MQASSGRWTPVTPPGKAETVQLRVALQPSRQVTVVGSGGPINDFSPLASREALAGTSSKLIVVVTKSV